MNPIIVLSVADWLNLFAHYLMMSLMSVGGAISTSSEMHRFLVQQNHWLTQAQFNDAIALAQAAPGPNVLFVALMGWQVGINAGSYPMAVLGVVVTMSGIMLPSSILTYTAAQWGHRNRELRAVRAFKQGMVPVVIALLLSTSWLLARHDGDPARHIGIWALALASGLVLWRTRVHLLWILAAGALAGASGLV